MSNPSIPDSRSFEQAFLSPESKTEYLQSRLAYFTSLAESALTASWRQFWHSQVDSIRQELKSKMVNPAIRTETGENDAY